jgi:formylmethanofuran dehydrogenase subunit C
VTGFVLRLREPPPERLDFSAVTPAALGRLSLREVEHLAVGTSRRGVALGECFAVSGAAGDDLTIEGGSPRLDGVGTGLERGRLRVEGDVGQRLGQGLRGGMIEVTGSAGPFAASGARGGTVVIEGDADERAGGALHGAPGGLDGATLIIRGRAGPRLGDRMRSGLIVVGHAGELAGCRMIAGTIAAGTLGAHPGYAMRRGTLLARSAGTLLPTFVETGTHRLVFARLLARALRPWDPELAELADGDLERRAGDLATLGNGELLTPR